MIPRKLILFLLLLALPCCVLTAQTDRKAWKKNVRHQLSAARTNIKNGTNLDDAEQAMRTLLLDSANIDNEKIWLTLFDALKKRHDQLNENLYLKQQSDTAQFLSNTLHLFGVLESMDSIDARPDADGVSRPHFRAKHAAYLFPYRKNLYGGGGYFLNKKDYAAAYEFFDSFADCSVQPLFTGYDFDERQLYEAAFRAVYCGYKLRRCDIIDKYSALALRDTVNEVYVLQYMAEACAMHEDSGAYHRALLTGFNKYPGSQYFFKHLAVFYSRGNQYGDLLRISDELLAGKPDDVPAMTAKSAALLHLERYDECIAVSDDIIARDTTKAAPYANAGLAYYNKILALEAKNRKSKAELLALNELYKKALPYFERYRSLAPDESDGWGTPLYNIYYNLNMGEEFDEIGRLLQRE
ncbi:MAG: hypothetical protein LUC26_04380 [Prevotella sp.]|nr:hypothetical protein [Prevotella sp.]